MRPRYAELHCKSNYSFLRGASHPDELVDRAAEVGLPALALTDRNGLYGAVRAHARARKRGIALLVGAEVVVDWTGTSAPGTLVLLAEDREGYAHLCRLLTRLHCGYEDPGEGGAPARREDPRLPLGALEARARGLFALLPQEALLAPGAGEPVAARLRDLFGERFALSVSRHRVTGEEERIAAVRALGRRAGIPVAVTNDVHLHHPGRQPVQDVLTCIRLGTTLADAGTRLFPNAERALVGPEEMSRRWSDFPEGLERAADIAERCRFRLEEIRGEHPLPPVGVELASGDGVPLPTANGAGTPFGGPAPRVRKAPDPARAAVAAGTPPSPSSAATPPAISTAAAPLAEVGPLTPRPTAAESAGAMAILRRLVTEGAQWRFHGAPPDDVGRQLARELDLVEQLGYASYFLTVWDLVRFARSRGILCQGRGSAANSAVCFVLGITAIDPVRMGLLFERFISVERGEPPDIDVDFEHERREEVIQYVYEKYGRDRAGMVCEVVSYRARSALREAGKALGLSLAQVDRLAKLVGSYEDPAQVGPEVLAQAGLDLDGSPAVRLTLELARELQGFPRHLSIHVGGFVVTRRPLCETVPLEPAAMPGRTVVQWDKDDLAELGLLKVDLLGLGMLSALSRSLSLLARERPAPALATPVPHPDSLATIPAEVPAVYEMVSEADTIGVFQIESRAQMSLLPRLRPRRFYDLVISVAIIRPGPIQGGMVHPYLRRRDGLEPVRYPYPPLEPVLAKTLGVPLFQEQAMRLAVVAAGFTPGEADELRRVMTHKRSHERLAEMKARLMDGMAQRNIPRADAEAIFRQLLGFAGYGFPESHAASFALLVYASAWLKRHHPAVFACALLNSQPMGFYAPHTLVEDARRHGVEVRGIDVTTSDWDCTLESAGAAPVQEPAPGDAPVEVSGCGSRPAAAPGCAAGECGMAGSGVGGSAAGEPPARSAAAPPAVRLGLRFVRGLPRSVGEAVAAARAERPFASVGDLVRRAALSRAWLARLAEAGALRAFAGARRDALWEALGVTPGAGGPDLLAGDAPPEPEATLPVATAAEEVVADYAATGLSERAHPLSLIRPTLATRNVRSARELQRLPDRAPVEVAGLVIVRQRPETARGIVFVSLEDETGISNLVVMPDIYARYRGPVRRATFLLARGRVERTDGVVNVRVESLAPLALAPAVDHRARDFH